MRKIKFRPLRVIKKSGKIVIASYMQWRSIKTADYNKFDLVIDESYKMLNDDDFVYNHLGKQLFFYDFTPNDFLVNPKIPKSDGFIPSAENTEEYLNFRNRNPYIVLDRGDYITYWCRGLDCDGVPTFSHYTADYIVSDNTRDFKVFEPLTVRMVKMWFGWFLWQLDNSKLHITQ
jgi:hypothetical protein